MNTYTVTFEETPVSQPPPALGVRYSNAGILLPKTAELIALPLGSLRGIAHSPHHVLVSDKLSKEFDPQPCIITFTQDVNSVTLFTGVPWDTRGQLVEIVLEALTGTGQLVERSSIQLVGPTDVTHPLQVRAAAGQHIIRQVHIDASQGGVSTFEYVDDLSFSSEGDPPIVASEPPTVKIKTPAAQTVTSTPSVQISGEISGSGLFPDSAPPVLFVSFPSPPGSALLPASDEFALGIDLWWTGTYLSFSKPFQLEYLGSNTITVTASNAAGVGSDQTTLFYLPADIEQEYVKMGGWASFGDFVWGRRQTDCTFAIYQNGAIHTSASGTFSLVGAVFTKWQSLTSPAAPLGLLGCAKGAQQSVPAGGASQDFVGGRIYSGPKGTFYVIEPFVTAIDALDFVATYGLPVTDPVSQNKTLLPRLWQKFERYIGTASFISTMEITDNPPTLWVAMPDIAGAVAAGAQVTGRVSTTWRSFSCTSVKGPCPGLAKPKAAKGLPYAALRSACGGDHYPWGPPQWVSLQSGKIVPFFGTVKSSGLAGSDAPWNHDCSCGGFDGVDYCIHALPDPEYAGLLAIGDGGPVSGDRTLLAPGYKQTTLEIEYEWCLVGFPDPDDPSKSLRPGDRLFVAGRFIADCGCHPWYSCSDPYRSEIHPPAVMVDIYSEDRFGQPATIADMVYFDWWYPGNVLEFDLFPPPRPSADALLSVSIPVWSKTMCPSDGGKCGVKYDVGPMNVPNHIKVKLDGRPDVQFNVPPAEDTSNGQLFHGAARACPGGREPVNPNWPHTKALLGDFVLTWTAP